MEFCRRLCRQMITAMFVALLLIGALPALGLAETKILYCLNGAGGWYGAGSELMLLGKVLDNDKVITGAEVTVTVTSDSGTEIHYAKRTTDKLGFFRTTFSLPNSVKESFKLTITAVDKTEEKAVALQEQHGVYVVGFVDCVGYREGEEVQKISAAETVRLGILFGNNVNYYNNRNDQPNLGVDSLGVNERNKDCFTLYKKNAAGTFVKIGCTVDLLESHKAGGEDSIVSSRIKFLNGEKGDNTERDAIYVKPSESLQSGTTYKLVIDRRLTANNSSSLGSNETFYFTTEGSSEEPKTPTDETPSTNGKSGGVGGGGSASVAVDENLIGEPVTKATYQGEETRIFGNDRIDTAIAMSQKGWPEKADTVVVAYAYSFYDALAAAPLAYKENAPILLTDQQRITSVTLAEIQRLNPAKVVLVGGTAVLSTEVENTLLETCQVTRYAGDDRYETAAQIADAVGTTGRAVVVNGQVYQDALVISGYAANQGIPILFTDRDTLPAVTTETLSSLGINRTIVIGGTGVVSAEVYAQLPSPTRYAGYDCYETATTVAGAAELNMNLENVHVVTGLDFADALVAGSLAARTLSPLIMVGGGDSLPTATENFFQTNKAKIKGFTVVGGTVVVPESQVDAIRNILK